MASRVAPIYLDDTYRQNNPTWDVEDSVAKGRQVLRCIDENRLQPQTVFEVGCGAGQILVELAKYLPDASFKGFEVSPQAYAICKPKESERIKFELQCLEDAPESADLLLAMDVLEHVEDYLGFLRAIRPKARHKLFHIPLDISVMSVLRVHPIMGNRARIGHLHYFFKDTALATLESAGYRVVSWRYLRNAVSTWKAVLMALPRQLCFYINQDLTVRLFGGWTLMVLAE